MCIDAPSDSKYGYHPRPNIVKNEKSGLVTDSHSILARWRNHVPQLLYVHEVNGRQTEIHTSDPLVPEPSTFDVETAMKRLKRHKSPGIDQIPADLIKQKEVHNILRSKNFLILFGRRRNCLRSGNSGSLYLYIRRVTKETVAMIQAYQFGHLYAKFYSASCCQG